MKNPIDKNILINIVTIENFIFDLTNITLGCTQIIPHNDSEEIVRLTFNHVEFFKLGCILKEKYDEYNIIDFNITNLDDLESDIFSVYSKAERKKLWYVTILCHEIELSILCRDINYERNEFVNDNFT